MSKPLTIEELKGLPVGEWVWVVDFTKSVYKSVAECGMYVQIKKYTDKSLDKELWANSLTNIVRFCYSDYGTTWIAYKNKEQAEAKKYKLIFNSQGGWEVLKYMPAYYQPLFRADTKEEAELILAKEYNVEVDE